MDDIESCFSQIDCLKKILARLEALTASQKSQVFGPSESNTIIHLYIIMILTLVVICRHDIMRLLLNIIGRFRHTQHRVFPVPGDASVHTIETELSLRSLRDSAENLAFQSNAPAYQSIEHIV